MKRNHSRKTVQGHHQDVSFIVDQETSVGTPILPPESIKVRLLTLELDQGSIGCAGAAFVMLSFVLAPHENLALGGASVGGFL